MTDDTVPASEQPSPQSTATRVSWLTSLQRVLATSLSDLVRGRYVGQSEVDSIIAKAMLPIELATLIRTVVRETRLWPSERADVARELVSHFRDGLNAGGVVADLLDHFGDSQLAARLIRQSRIRCRQSWWRVARFAALMVALLPLLYVVLAVRFFWSRPTIARNYLREFNEQARAAPEAQRAWPLYRMALKERIPYPKPGKDQAPELEEGWWFTDNNRVSPDSAAWKSLQNFVQQNQRPIQLIHEAARRPERGIIYGDPEDIPQDRLGDDRPLISVLLPQIQEMRSFARLLSADAMIATAARDADRLTNDFQSLILMSEQTHGHWIIEDLVSTAIMQTTMSTILDSLEDAPTLMTDNQLVDIAQRLAAYRGGGTIRFDMSGEQSSMDDILQRCYTDDGHGDGSLTPDGIKLLAQLRSDSSIDKDELQQTSLSKALLAPAVMFRSMSRRESREVQNRLFEETQLAIRGPIYTWAESDCEQNFFVKGRHRYTTDDMIGSELIPAFSIPMLFFPAIEQSATAAERLCQVRDGLLTAIAIELYHRRHGTWPQTLEQLVPRDLAELPLDRFTGQPLQYRIQNGRPLIYACGMDQQDDGGRHPSLLLGGGNFHQQIFGKPQTPPAPGDGYDWVLFPRPRQPQQEQGK